MEVRWEQDQHGMKPSQTLLPTAHTSFSSLVFLVLQLYFNLFFSICMCMKPSKTLLPTAQTSFSFLAFLVLQLYFHLCLYLYEAITDSHQTSHSSFSSLRFVVLQLYFHLCFYLYLYEAITDLRTREKEEFLSFRIIHPIIKKGHLMACQALRSPFLL